MSNISIDFQRARRLSRELDEEAERIRNLANQTIQGVLDLLQGQWEGESAEAFFRKCLQMNDKLLDEAKRLNQAAALIRARIEAIYQAEQIAKNIATTRNGG